MKTKQTEIDMHDVSVYDLLQMLERGDKLGYSLLTILKVAEQRMIKANSKPRCTIPSFVSRDVCGCDRFDRLDVL